MTSTTIPPDRMRELRAALRKRAGAWIARFYRHELLVARTVRGMQQEAVEEFGRLVVRPMLREVGAGLAGVTVRGPDVVMATMPGLAQLEREIVEVAKRGSDAVRRLTTERLHELTREESEWVAESARKVLGVEPVPAPAAVEKVTTRPFLGDNVERWFGKMLAVPMGDKARAWVQTGLQRGLTTDQITRVLRDKILTGEGTRAVQTLVRTAATHASTVARGESFRGLGVTHWRFVATLDTKTSIQCAANDGKTFALGEGPQPPLHPNCRSTAVPDFGEPIGTRASTDGPVPAEQTFAEWLEGRTVAEQDEMLGRTRAQAWRAGDLSLDRMLGRDLQPLTLRELRDLDRIPDPEDE